MSNTERDDLARIIMSPESFDGGPVSCGPNPVYAARTADAILAAGYRKSSTITTAAELDALPWCSVIMSDEGTVFQKFTMWHEAGSRDLRYTNAIALPATVLHEGATE